MSHRAGPPTEPRRETTRAWPFENRVDDEPIRRPEQFVARSGDGTEAVVVRIGLGDAQLVLVDGEGGWDRWVYASTEEATRIAESLGVPVHVGEFPEATRVRMNQRVRTAEDFRRRGAYPEQGRVGPIRSYPENRPRRVEAPATQAPPEAPG
jgi:hypothetical protein